MKRILIVNVNWAGDVIFSTPFIRTIRKNYPDAFLACLVVPRCKDILETNKYLDKVIVNDEEGKHSGFLGKFRLISELKKYNFDTVFLLHRSLTRTLICMFSGIKERIGYSTKKRSFFLTKKIPPVKENIHRALTFLKIAECMGLKKDGDNFDFFVPENSENEIKNICKEISLDLDKKFIVINPGGNWLPKRWPSDKFSKLADKLNQEFKIPIVITGAKKDIVLAKHITSLMKTQAYILAGKTNLKQLAALFKKATLVISNDTGPLHISRAVGTSVLGIYGPTSDKITGFLGDGKYNIVKSDLEECQVPCYNTDCNYYKCMQTIKVNDVFKACKKILFQDHYIKKQYEEKESYKKDSSHYFK